ncbi:MAG: PIG-L family deacetylase [Candidatus Wildermuthbacteria bacterium]|nr:PIG-L family deacetylase [Candidatus Wildermuthbacteria bacterium]
MRKFLAISAHPDDSDFGAAGTIARLAQQGDSVDLLIVSDGSKGSHHVGFGGKRLSAIREKEQKASATVTGAGRVYFLKELDGEVENTKRLRKKLVEVIRRVRPDVILSCDPVALFERAGLCHKDHRETAVAVFDAVYPAAGSESFFPELKKRGFLPHSVSEMWFWGAGVPTKHIDISKTIEKKIEALLCHKSQIADPKMLEVRIRERARDVARGKRAKYAEGFRVLKLS